MNVRSLGRLLVILALIVASGLKSYATQTDNHGMHAVPVPGKVVIDGKLDDWDLSGQTLMCYDIETLRDVYSVEVAMMYDSDNVYFAFHWKDPNPMSNSHDPHYQAAKGWAGDSVQIRFKTDRIAHVTAWYYAARKEPTIQIDYGKSLTEPFGGPSIQCFQTEGWKLTNGAEMAFVKDADGKGYVQEMKLPWKLVVDKKHMRPGDTFNCGVETLWGSVDWPVMRYADNMMPGKSSREFFFTAYDSWGPVTLEPKGNLHLPTPDYLVRAMHPAAETPGPVPIAYDLPTAGRVTIVIEDLSGRRLRNLVPSLPRPKGKNIEHWDGLDDNGKAVDPGKYRFRGIYHDGIHLNWALSFANPGNPTWTTPNGRGAYYADHTYPRAAAASGDFVALACPMGEAGNPLIGCDLTGQRLWGQANRVAFNSSIQSLATDGTTVWVAAEDTKSYIYRDEIGTGRYSPWNKTALDEHGTPYKVLDLQASDLPGYASDGHPSLNLTSIAYRDGTLAVCLARENRIKLLDSATGAVKREVAVGKPQSVVIDKDSSLIVLSEGKLVRVAGDGNLHPFAAQTYPDGFGLAIDTKSNIYLSVRGADQNVKVFNADGKFLREIGKRGGRPLDGAYDENGMRNPAGIAIDSKGRLWVTEEADNPKRTSMWGADGKLVIDLAGCNHYSAAGSLDPFDATLAYSDDTVYKLDWDKGTFKPIYSMHTTDSPDAISPPHVHDITSRILKHGEDRLFYTPEEYGKAVGCTVARSGRYVSAGRIGTVPDADEIKRSGFADRYGNTVFKGHAGEVYAWADKNGDGLVQPNEIQYAKLEYNGKPIWLESFYWGTLPAPDGTITYINRQAQSLIQFSISGYTECGAPIYDIAHPRITPVDMKVLGLGNGEGMILGGSNGITYLNQDPIIAVDKTGHVLFTYPSHFTSVHGSHDAQSAKPGYVIGPSSIVGTADMGGETGEVFDMNGNLGEHYLFTADGMYVQALFKDVRGGYEVPERAVRGVSFDANTAGGESFGANFVRSANGKVYLTIGSTDAVVLEVTGLDTIKRIAISTFTYSPSEYAAALKLAELNAQKASEPKIYTVERAAAPITIDGKSDKWPELKDDAKSLIEIQDSPDQRFARVQARWDDDNLYLAYRVFASTDRMRNVGQDDRLLFKTGDAVDLMFGPADSKTDAGELRVLLTQRGADSETILYQKSIPGTSASARVPFASPVRTIYFDKVRPVSQVKMAGSGIDRGYFVEAAIPWSVLGVKPTAGLRFRADVGVLFADSGGTITVSRRYWSNKATGLVNDIPGEADLTPNLWGTFVLK